MLKEYLSLGNECGEAKTLTQLNKNVGNIENYKVGIERQKSERCDGKCCMDLLARAVLNSLPFRCVSRSKPAILCSISLHCRATAVMRTYLAFPIFVLSMKLANQS